MILAAARLERVLPRSGHPSHEDVAIFQAIRR
jgi:hypothetical protein